jgi:4-alpha-glucanotransferase
MAKQLQQLRQLARLFGVQTAYYDVTRRRRPASTESLLKVLQVLGAPVGKLADVPDALRARRQEWWQRLCEPVLVAWEGAPVACTVRLLEEVPQHGTLACHLQLESGEEMRWSIKPGELPVVDSAEVEGRRYAARTLVLPTPLPLGYHRLRLRGQGHSGESLVLSAPLRAYTPSQKTWGVFLPLYALHSERSWGGGDFSDLETLGAWLAQRGGSVVATLPLLTAFLDDPFDPSPYAPASRLFWNEFYVDVTRVPELQQCPTAQVLLTSSGFRQEIAALRSLAVVDYRRQMALKRSVLAELARNFFAEPSSRTDAFRRFVASQPSVEDYARFRAVGERLRTPWPQWPQPSRDGVLEECGADEEVKRYHLYAQWIAHEQLRAVAERVKGQGAGLYLDLPLGVHAYSYDVWREREAFAVHASGGAPPDAVFTKGQDWGFPPLHPEKNREQGYRYVIAYIRHHLRHASLLRIDHVMGLHRLFWVPRGYEPNEGAYVRYPAEELYAILTLESRRHAAAVVGENLGTVPAAVNAAMARHRIHRMYVLQYELATVPQQPLRAVPTDEVASVNTHDMPPFAAFWQGLDLQDRFELGLMDEAGLRRERQNLQTVKSSLIEVLRRHRWLQEGGTDLQAILTACLSYLAASPARVVLVNLEDLWLEPRPQNVPGTGIERPNWCRKTRDQFEVWSQMPRVIETLATIDPLRRRKRGHRGDRARKTSGPASPAESGKESFSVENPSG